jgi:hypothetical protein
MSLIPVLSSALNLGVALGGYVTTLPSTDERFPATAIAVWFEVFFLPGFVLAVILGLVSLVAGVHVYRCSPNTTMMRYALVGLVFTGAHFGFGNSVCATFHHNFERTVSKLFRSSGTWLGY